MISKKTKILLKYLLEMKPMLESYRQGLAKFIFLEIEKKHLSNKTFEELSDHFLLDFYYKKEKYPDRLTISGLELHDTIYVIQKNNQEIMYKLE